MAEVKKTAKKAPVKKAVVKKTAVVKKPAVKKAPAKKVVAKVEAAPIKEVETKVEAKVEAKKAPEVKVVEEVKAAAPVEKAAVSAATVSADGNVEFDFDLQEMLDAGCHFGHKASKWHPKMAPYIYTEKDGIHLFDLPKSAALLDAACKFVYNLGKEGKTLVIVGTKKQARDIVKAAAIDANCFYMTARWMGGLLTNWTQVSQSIKRMESIKEGLLTDKYKGYTKYERVQLEKEQIKLERFFGGLKGLRQQPDCMIVVDPKKEDIAVQEANSMNVPVLALIDTDSDPRTVSMVIPGNDDAAKSIEYYLNQLAMAYKLGRSSRK